MGSLFMAEYNFYFGDGGGCPCGLPQVIDLGYAIWMYRDSDWHVVKECCKGGCSPGAKPDKPGDFNGHLRALPCRPDIRKIPQEHQDCDQ